MTYAKVTIFDLDHSTEGQTPPHVETDAEWDGEATSFKGLKISITVGDAGCGASVTLPFEILSQLVAYTMAKHNERQMMYPPKLIIPN